MHEYGLSLSEALDIPSAIASDLLYSAGERRRTEAEMYFGRSETLANLIKIKVSELLSGKPVKYDSPFKSKNNQPVKNTPMTDAQMSALAGMSKI